MSDDLTRLQEALEDETDTGTAKRLTTAEWEEVKTLWEIGSTTLAELSERFGVRSDTLQKRLKSHGIVKGSRAGLIEEAVVEDAQNHAQINAKRIRETKDAHYGYNDALAKLIMGEVLSARRQQKPFASVDANITALGKAAKGLQVILKDRYKLLGLDKDDGDPEDIPELLISEMTEQQIDDIRRELRGEGQSIDDELAMIDANIGDDIVDEGV